MLATMSTITGSARWWARSIQKLNAGARIDVVQVRDREEVVCPVRS